jgi:hypothetical protein
MGLTEPAVVRHEAPECCLMGKKSVMLHDVCCLICQSVVWRRCCVSRARILPSRNCVRPGTCWGQQLGPKLTGCTLAHGFPTLASEWLWGLFISPLGLIVATHGTAFRRLTPPAQRTGAAAAARTHSALSSLSRHSRSRTAVCVVRAPPHAAHAMAPKARRLRATSPAAAAPSRAQTQHTPTAPSRLGCGTQPHSQPAPQRP